MRRLPAGRAWTMLSLAVVAGMVPAQARAADPIVPASQAVKDRWIAKDTTGKVVEVPSERTSVLAFVRADQPQSKEALAVIRAAVPDANGVQVIVVVSGQSAAQQAEALGKTVGWPVVVDPDFVASGNRGVHVWPTTTVIRSDGREVAHIPGISSTYAVDLQAYLDYAAGRVDDAALKQRLSTRQVVSDGPEQMAGRYLQVAQRLVEIGQPDRAREELFKGLKVHPNDGPLQLELARVQIALNDPKAALELVDHLPADSAPAWRVNLVRGKALVAMGRWDQAKEVLPQAMKLNPNPAEAHYLLGQVHEHEQQWQQAAEQYRMAFEAATSAVKMRQSAEAK